MTGKMVGGPAGGWFEEARFGLFIHWGLYALGARHEWLKNYEEMSTEDYEKYFERFNPDLYAPAEWARLAHEAGMKYFVITTKHHDGFCLWDSRQTDYKVTNTPYGRDLLTPMVEAFRKEGLKVGFYHSLIDWHHPHFPLDAVHPQRNHPDYDKINNGRDMGIYREYLKAQVEELLTGFGKIDYLFFDFSYTHMKDGKGRADWGSEEILEMCRELQPGMLVNDRLDLLDVEGGWDVRTPEQIMIREGVKHEGKPVRWETCQTFSGSWGYHRDETSWKSPKQLLILLIDTVSKGGNLLLNVGPTARGKFDKRAVQKLAGMGGWLKKHGRAVYGCTSAPDGFIKPDNCILTYNPKLKRLYVHVLVWPIENMFLDFPKDRVEYAQLLHDGSEVLMNSVPDWQQQWVTEDENILHLRLPVRKPDVTVPVIELFLKG